MKRKTVPPLDAHDQDSTPTQIKSRKRQKREKIMKRKIKRLMSGMNELEVEQDCMREELKGIREEFQEIMSKTDQLKEETELISKTSAGNQLKLDLMFGIVRAKELNDLANVSELTDTLREVTTKQKEETPLE